MDMSCPSMVLSNAARYQGSTTVYGALTASPVYADHRDYCNHSPEVGRMISHCRLAHCLKCQQWKAYQQSIELSIKLSEQRDKTLLFATIQTDPCLTQEIRDTAVTL